MKSFSPSLGLLLCPAWWHAGSSHLTQPWCETLSFSSTPTPFLSEDKKVQKPGYVLDGQILVQFGTFQVLQLVVDCRNYPRQLIPLNCAFNMGNREKMTKQKKINLDVFLVVVKYQVSA